MTFGFETDCFFVGTRVGNHDNGSGVLLPTSYPFDSVGMLASTFHKTRELPFL